MFELSRRSVLTGGAATLGAGILGGRQQTEKRWNPDLWQQTGALGAPSVTGLHLQFGSDASREMTVSWITPAAVRNPRVEFGTVTGGPGRTVQAETRRYRDGVDGGELFAHHARIGDLSPDTRYVYFATHDGATPDTGVFTTGPRGRKPLRFTSFGDQGTVNLRQAKAFPPGTPGGNGPYPVYTSSDVGSQASADIVQAIERASPLFNLLNGDLCYAAIGAYFGQPRTPTWSDWFISNSRSTRYRPWMPCPGNHENERANGQFGFDAYRNMFALPSNGGDPAFQGLWYSFTAGSVRIISVSNDDVAIQDAGDSYIRGYSGGAQRRWLEAELRGARADKGIDWIVVCMHQTMISSAQRSNGSDLGVRQAWGPLFDQYGVDLVVCGHEHHYERSHAVRGSSGNDTATPIPVDTGRDLIDTEKGTVHMVIGGGGNFATSEKDLYDRPEARVIVALSDKDSPILPGHKDSVWVNEDAPWASFQDRANPHGFAAFDVDPGRGPGDKTRLKVTYYTFEGPFAELRPVDEFVLERRRRDDPDGVGRPGSSEGGGRFGS
ncbi:purple acid phosphatase family protein [Rhodococcus sp. NPDC127528]|uniref:purple acid phosphatase family protein n=1 Tax=unclassified Rhodococcus (in: high G+C Gram-positive bacteria) TaxID=192944 RepID=UPI0036434978